MTAQQILVIEDEAPLRERMMRMLQFEGFTPIGAENGQQGLDIARSTHLDAIICDILMPGLGGDAVVPILRADVATKSTPIIMVTALSDRATQRRFMEAGVDDFLVKPFTYEELLGTLRAQLKKHGPHEKNSVLGDAEGADVEIRIGQWRYDPAARRLLHDSGKRVWLTSAEGHIFQKLIEHIGRPVSREVLYASLKNDNFSPADRSTDILVARIRRKLGDNPRQPALLRTIRNVGYMLEN